VFLFSPGLAARTVCAGRLLTASVLNQPQLAEVAALRDWLLEQETFRHKMEAHAAEAMANWNENGTASLERRYMQRVPLKIFGQEVFYDVWAVWVYSEIVDGKVHTSFLVRMGVAPDENAATFFSNQTSVTPARSMIHWTAGVFNGLLANGFLTPMRASVTEADVTSRVSGQYLDRAEWLRISSRMYRHRHQPDKKGTVF
jgi:hypothetical protein